MGYAMRETRLRRKLAGFFRTGRAGTGVRRTRDGVEFLGFRVFPTHRVPLKRKSRQYFRHLKCLQSQYAAGRIAPEKVRQSVMSWIGHVLFGASGALRRSVLSQVSFSKGRAVRPPGAGEVLPVASTAALR